MACALLPRRVEAIPGYPYDDIFGGHILIETFSHCDRFDHVYSDVQ